MGMLSWILSTRVARRYGLTDYIAGAVPKDVTDKDRKKETDGYKQTIDKLRSSNNGLEEQITSVRAAFDESRRLTLGYEEKIEALKGILKFNIEKYSVLEIEHENLKGRIEEDKKEDERKAIEFEARREFYLRHIKTALKTISETSRRAKKLEDSFEERVLRIEDELQKRYEEETTRAAEDFREGLKEYEESLGKIIDRHNKRADEAEKQQVFLQGDLIRKEREFIEDIKAYAKFLFKLGEKNPLSKNIGLIFDRRLDPIYATPKFYEVNGISEDELYKIKIPQLICNLQDKKEECKVRYKDHDGREHLGTIYSLPISNKEGKVIGTYLQIDQTTGDWLKEKAHFFGKKSNLIDLISEGRAELSRNT